MSPLAYHTSLIMLKRCLVVLGRQPGDSWMAIACGHVPADRHLIALAPFLMVFQDAEISKMDSNVVSSKG